MAKKILISLICFVFVFCFSFKNVNASDDLIVTDGSNTPLNNTFINPILYSVLNNGYNPFSDEFILYCSNNTTFHFVYGDLYFNSDGLISGNDVVCYTYSLGDRSFFTYDNFLYNSEKTFGSSLTNFLPVDYYNIIFDYYSFDLFILLCALLFGIFIFSGKRGVRYG